MEVSFLSQMVALSVAMMPGWRAGLVIPKLGSPRRRRPWPMALSAAAAPLEERRKSSCPGQRNGAPNVGAAAKSALNGIPLDTRDRQHFVFK